MNDLEILREKIDAIDQKIVRLLEERMEISRLIGEYKSANSMPVLDLERENAVIQSRCAMISDKTMENAVREIYNLIMRISREYQWGAET